MKIEKEELIRKVREVKGLSDDEKAALIGYIKTKTYGLVWEDSTEKVWEQLKDYIPVLTEDKSKAIINDTDEQKNPNHILIEGDNLLALTNLCFTHEGKVDVIYIDPPYNTGNKDFIYNDSFVDAEDNYRHSKWLSFMEKRLKIARRLLSDKGVIFISIDDNEQANLKLLCDQILGEVNFISTMIWRKQGGGKADSRYLANNTEFILCYGKNPDRFRTKEPDSEIYNKEDELGRKYRLMSLDFGSLSYHKSLDYPITLPNNVICYPGGDEGKWKQRQQGNHSAKDWTWRCSQDEYKKRLEEGRIEFTYNKKTGKWKVQERLYLENREGGLYENLITDFTNRTANNEIQSIFGDRAFAYPKPTLLIKFILSLINNKSLSILDFFAGSGTTLQATMQLNTEDGGHRQCILVTNNENNICEEVTYKRNKRVIEGYKKPNGEFVEGLKDNNLRYFKVGYVPREKDLTNIERFARQSVNLLCIKEDVYKEQTMFGELEADGFRYFKDDDKQFLVILEPDMIEPIIEELTKMDYKGKMPVYVFATGHYPYTEDFWQVSEKVDLYPYPSCVYGACEKVMPKMEDKLLDLPDDVKLSDEEANMTFEDLINE